MRLQEIKYASSSKSSQVARIQCVFSIKTSAENECHIKKISNDLANTTVTISNLYQ